MTGPLSARNPNVSHLRRLLGRRRARLDHGQFVIEGTILVADALEAGWPLEAIYVDGGAVLDPSATAALARAAEAGVPVRELADGVLARIADVVTPQPLLAVASRPTLGLEALGQVGAGPILVLVGVTDPGNAGTLVRSAEASGAGPVVFTGGAVDPFGPKTVRSSAGAVLHVPIVEEPDPVAVLAALGEGGVRRLSTVAHGGEAYDRVDLAGPVAFVLGSEAHGLPPVVDAQIDGVVTIPMVGRSESLNVAMAGTLLCFDHLRRRTDWTTRHPDDRVSG